MWYFAVLYYVVLVFFLLLLTRLVLEWIQVFARDWRPRGFVLLVAEAAYSATDPPLRLVRKVLPPLRIGHMSLDLAFLVVALVCSVLLQYLSVA